MTWIEMVVSEVIGIPQFSSFFGDFLITIQPLWYRNLGKRWYQSFFLGRSPPWGKKNGVIRWLDMTCPF